MYSEIAIDAIDDIDKNIITFPSTKGWSWEFAIDCSNGLRGTKLCVVLHDHLHI